MTKSKKSQRSLLALFAVFVLPLLGAVALFATRDQLVLTTPVSHGQLIYPAQPVSQFEFNTPTKRLLTKDYLQGKWTFLLYISAVCDLECEAALFKVRQTMRATGKDRNRMQYLLLSQSTASSAIDQSIQQRHPQLLVGQLMKWETDMDAKQEEALASGYVYVIDPFGNLMMRYDSNATSKGLLKDLKKLLRVSKIG